MTDVKDPILQDLETVQSALRRLNPEFHEMDSSWTALARLYARAVTEEDHA